jgi:hypothetical protein
MFKVGICMAGLSMALSNNARADNATCNIIEHAGSKMKNVAIKTSGHDFAQDTPDIYGGGTETCTRIRDEDVDGKPATLYSQDFVASKGTTHALIWISHADGTVLREELDGDIKGKGKGHETMIVK